MELERQAREGLLSQGMSLSLHSTRNLLMFRTRHQRMPSGVGLRPALVHDGITYLMVVAPILLSFLNRPHS